MARPNFLVVGTPKGGTTSLFAYLDAHPDIFVPPEKELDYFNGITWDDGVAAYEAKFRGARGESAIGELSARYSCWPAYPDVPQRVAAYRPDMRLIYIVRHPIDRMISRYRHSTVQGNERRPIEEALRKDKHVYLTPSRYSAQIEQWLPHFDRSQLLVLVSEHLRTDRAATMRRVFDFLGVDPAPADAPADEHHRGEDLRTERPLAGLVRHHRGWRSVRRLIPAQARRAAWRVVGSRGQDQQLDLSISDGVRAELVAYLRSDLERLPGYVGGDFDAWGLLADPLARVATGNATVG